MLVVELAGTHCCGKSTTAQLLAKRYGFRYVTVKDNSCPGLKGRERQKCFIESFHRRLLVATAAANNGRPVVADNSLVSVAAYCLLFGYEDLAEEAINTWLKLPGRRILVVLTAHPDVLVRRCVYRDLEKGIRPDKAKFELETTVKVQQLLLDILAKHKIPYHRVDTSYNDPETVAATVYNIAKQYMRSQYKKPAQAQKTIIDVAIEAQLKQLLNELKRTCIARASLTPTLQ